MNEINPIIIELLRKRGITDEADIQEYLSEKPQKTYNPFLLADMEAGVDLILSKIKDGEQICIYGDYDADGITAVSLLYQVLSELTEKLSYYIPSRFDEGYGLNTDAIQTIKKSGAGLIITVDCGSVSYEEVEYAKDIGIEMIVTDHHSITNRRADCILINPKRPDCPYPFKHLAGVGVAFKLAQALQQKSGLPKSVLTRVLDLVALGTIGDVVPLTNENRTMVKFGIRVVQSAMRPGLKRLLQCISLAPEKVSSENIAFAVVPHLNAAGRMKNAGVAAELLLSQNQEEIEQCVQTLIDSNRTRKTVQEQTYRQCIEVLENERRKKVDTLKDADKSAENAILLYLPSAHEGITGIVAGKIREKYGRPTLIVTPSGESDTILKGTGRSVEKVNLYELLKNCEDLFLKFGGHAGACGFLMEKENLPVLRQRIEGKLTEMFEEDKTLFDLEQHIDMELSLSMITEEFAELIGLLEPFGSENPKPLFRVANTKASFVSRMGTEQQHARFTAEDGSGRIQCVLFHKAAEYMDLLLSGRRFNAVGTVEMQYWNGNRRIQMILSNIEK